MSSAAKDKTVLPNKEAALFRQLARQYEASG